MAEWDSAVAPSGRLAGVLLALVGATLGFALGEALAAARTSDVFIVAPGASRIGVYAASLLLLSCVAFALALGGPPMAARGGRAARQAKAAIRRRLRHGRSRDEIGKVETGLTVSFCIVLLGIGAAFATPKAVLVVVVTTMLLLTIQGLLALCRLARFAPGWCTAFGFLYGLGGGYLIS